MAIVNGIMPVSTSTPTNLSIASTQQQQQPPHNQHHHHHNRHNSHPNNNGTNIKNSSSSNNNNNNKNSSSNNNSNNNNNNNNNNNTNENNNIPNHNTNGQEQTFTVEQIELIRRLRNSGMNKSEIVQAWDILDRVDSQLGQVYNIPVSYANQLQAAVTLMGVQNAIHSTLQQQQQQQILDMKALSATSSSSTAAVTAAAAVAATLSSSTNQSSTSLSSSSTSSSSRKRSSNDNDEKSSSVINPMQISANDCKNLLRNLENSRDIVNNHATTGHDITNIVLQNQQQQQQPQQHHHHHQQPLTAQQQMQQMLQLQQMAQISNEEFENSQELKDFLAQGEVKCCEEIKNFVVKHNIKQHQIASLAGLSQSYISRYFRGDPVEMSLRSRRAIYKWYLTFRDFPEAIGPAVSMTLLTGTPPTKNMLGPLEAQAVVNQHTTNSPNAAEFSYPKRERFVFRPCHIEVLERSYEADNYPSIEKREEIARNCNLTLENMAGRAVGDREKVTTQTVTNWFANRRKEMKKIKISGDDDGGGGGAPTPKRIRGKLPSLSGNSCDSATNSPQQNNTYYGDDHEFGYSNNVDMKSTIREQLKERELQMKYRVEMAAVNQAILALSGTTPINIHGTDEDEEEDEEDEEDNRNANQNNNDDMNDDDNDEEDEEEEENEDENMKENCGLIQKENCEI